MIPLPEPDLIGGIGDYRRHYTQEKLIEYGRACAQAERERCAKVCDAIESELWDRYKRGNVADRANPVLESQSDGACECAAAIRALKDDPIPAG